MRYKCINCNWKFDEPLVVLTEVFDYEYWGLHGIHSERVECCPSCQCLDLELIDDSDEYLEIIEDFIINSVDKNKL